jgi:hypothetical protein
MLPVLLPMECAYSHSTTGRCSTPASASATSCASCGMRAYIGHTTSVEVVREPPPCGVVVVVVVVVRVCACG